MDLPRFLSGRVLGACILHLYRVYDYYISRFQDRGTSRVLLYCCEVLVRLARISYHTYRGPYRYTWYTAIIVVEFSWKTLSNCLRVYI